MLFRLRRKVSQVDLVQVCNDLKHWHKLDNLWLQVRHNGSENMLARASSVVQRVGGLDMVTSRAYLGRAAQPGYRDSGVKQCGV